ncbi:hypothetical protein HELRODRAFT_171110 [Helobdella robusta]|uniref:Tim44-like domain-containing protein n=1 Tax=Helobdella robusta TaxID=6412 RepID=T1F3T7_HELRO|nr:hypothetical protein HELRODRAFT_171110 [Helobdella robusta]ESO05479.1 hypothetical protein HELRODRAFT_171110 [Helobdella robusta]
MWGFSRILNHKISSPSKTHGRGDGHLLAASQNAVTYQRRGFSDDSEGSRTVKDLQLMKFTQLIWPNIFKSIRNFFFSFLIRRFVDEEFTLSSFLCGAEQAVGIVSSCISRGDFNSLNGLVTREFSKAVEEIKQNYNLLTEGQKKFIMVDPRNIFLKFVYEIGMIFEDKSNRKFIEITTVMQGYHGLERIKDENVRDLSSEMIENRHNLFVCNYREFARDREDYWIVNKLNHFSPQKSN